MNRKSIIDILIVRVINIHHELRIPIDVDLEQKIYWSRRGIGPTTYQKIDKLFIISTDLKKRYE